MKNKNLVKNRQTQALMRDLLILFLGGDKKILRSEPGPLDTICNINFVKESLSDKMGSQRLGK